MNEFEQILWSKVDKVLSWEDLPWILLVWVILGFLVYLSWNIDKWWER